MEGCHESPTSIITDRPRAELWFSIACFDVLLKIGSCALAFHIFKNLRLFDKKKCGRPDVGFTLYIIYSMQPFQPARTMPECGMVVRLYKWRWRGSGPNVSCFIYIIFPRCSANAVDSGSA